MILKALYDYYHRSGNLPIMGMELKEIGFIIVIDKCGNFLRFEDRRIDKKSAQQFLVKKSVGRSSAPVANYLYDNSNIVFGYSDKGTWKACASILIHSKRRLKKYTTCFQIMKPCRLFMRFINKSLQI